jgi:DNA/RNA-binding domain of Phe-tRNA-synthetase-like protein
MHFVHARGIWNDYPQLVAAALAAHGINDGVVVQPRLDKYTATAESRLAAHTEAELPEIQAWRRAFSSMGLKPTQYRSAAESLLRRYRKERSLPQIHPLIDLCNAVSIAFATPIAVFDVARIADYLEVRRATGSEVYEAFSGEVESPVPREVIFADGGGSAHARRWTNRQSRRSAVSSCTTSVLIVAEALHESADADVPKLMASLVEELEAVWSVTATAKLLTSSSPRFEFEARAEERHF